MGQSSFFDSLRKPYKIIEDTSQSQGPESSSSSDFMNQMNESWNRRFNPPALESPASKGGLQDLMGASMSARTDPIGNYGIPEDTSGDFLSKMATSFHNVNIRPFLDENVKSAGSISAENIDISKFKMPESMSDFMDRWSPFKRLAEDWDKSSGALGVATFALTAVPKAAARAAAAAITPEQNADDWTRLGFAVAPGMIDATRESPITHAAVGQTVSTIAAIPKVIDDFKDMLWNRDPWKIYEAGKHLVQGIPGVYLARNASGNVDRKEDIYNAQIAMGLGGMVMEGLTDPLTYTTFGGNAVWQKMNSVIKAPPASSFSIKAGIGPMVQAAENAATVAAARGGPNAAQLAQLASVRAGVRAGNAAPNVRMLMSPKYQRVASELTDEVIENVGAPRMVADSIDGFYREAVLDPAQRQPIVDVMDRAFGNNNSFYQQELQRFRSMPRDAEILREPGILPDLTVGATDEVMTSLARHQVSLERAARNGAPATRLFGYRVAPSPFSIPGRLLGRAFGSWRDLEALRAPSSQLFDAAEQMNHPSSIDVLSGMATSTGTMADMFAGATSITTPAGRVWRDHVQAAAQLFPYGVDPDVSLGALEQLMRHRQSGANFMSALIVNPDSLRVFIQNEVRGALNPADRPYVFDMLENVYRTFQRAAQRDPRLLFSVTREQLDSAVEAISRMKQDPEFWNDVASAARLPGGGPGAFNEGYRRIYDDISNVFNQNATLFNNAISSNDPDRLVEAYYTCIENMKRINSSQLSDFMQMSHDILNSTVPYQYSASYRQFSADMANRLTWIRQQGDDAQRMMEQFFSNIGNNTSQDAMETLSKIFYRTKQGSVDTDFFNRWNQWLDGVRSTPTPGGAAIPDQADIDALRNMVDNQLINVERLDRGMPASNQILRPGEADALRQWLGVGGAAVNPQRNDEMYYRLASAMSDMVGHVTRDRLANSVAQRWTTPLMAAQARASELLMRNYEKPLRQMLDQWNVWKSVYDPTWLGRAYTQYVGPWLDKLENYVQRYAGIPPNLAKTIEENETKTISAYNEAEDFAHQFIRNDMKPILIRLAPARPNGSNYINNTMVRDFGEGFTKIYGYQPALDLAADRAARRIPLSIMEQRAVEVANERVAEGWAQLDRVFGNRTTSQNAFGELQTIVQRHHREMFDAERTMGAVGQHFDEYLTNGLRGSYREQAKFRNYWRNDNPNFAGESAVRNQVLASTAHSPSGVRVYKNMAELEAGLIDTNADIIRNDRNTFLGRVSDQPTSPLKLEVEHDISALLAHRRLLHNKLRLNTEFVSRLRSDLPEHVLPITDRAFHLRNDPERLKLVEDQLTSEGWHRLRDTIPGMRDWWVRGDLLEWLKEQAPRTHGVLDFEDEMANFLARSNKWLKTLNVMWDLNHIRNIIGLTLVGRMDWRLFGRNLRTVLEDGVPNILDGNYKTGSFWERVKSPMNPIEDAVACHPLYSLGERFGLFGTGAQENMVPVMQRIRSKYNPSQFGLSTFYEHPWQMIRERTGPFDRLMFGLFDHTARLTLFEQYLRKGIDPKHAASMVNHYMIDYSTRWMSPKARMSAYSWFPFFAWQAGNWKVHMTEPFKDPRWYAIMSHLRNETVRNYTGYTKDYEAPEQFADAWATGLDQNGGRVWMEPGFPWLGVHRLMNDVTSKNPLRSWIDVGEYLTFRTNPITSFTLNQITNYAAKKKWEQDNLSKILFGTEDTKGLFQNTFWGWTPEIRMGIDAYKVATGQRDVYEGAKNMLWNASELVMPHKIEMADGKPYRGP